MLDVHVLTLNSSRKDWLRECLESIQIAMERCPFAVNLHLVQGIEGHIGLGRDKGYALGDHPFVTYVDDDDFVLPDAFRNMRDAIQAKPDVIFTPEYVLQNGFQVHGERRHHLSVYARGFLIDHSAYTVCGDYAQIRYAERANRVIDLPKRTYVHRLYQSGGRKLRREYPDEWRKVCGKHPT
jgi:hypothetical protein